MDIPVESSAGVSSTELQDPPLCSYLTFTEAAKLLPRRVSLSTMCRWAERGARGKQLRTVLCGGRRFTTAAWLDEFWKTPAARPDVPRPATSAQRAREKAAAIAELAEARRK